MGENKESIEAFSVDENKKNVDAFRMDDIRDRLAGISYMLSLMADEGIEESPALRNLAREVDEIYAELWAITAEV